MLAVRRVKNFFKADKLVRFFKVGKTVGTDPCRNRDGSFGAVVLLAAGPVVALLRGGDDKAGNAVRLSEETLILSDWRSCSTVTMEGRLVSEADGKMPRAPIAGGRGLGDVVGLASVGSTRAGGEKCFIGAVEDSVDGESSSTRTGGEKYFTTAGSGLDA